VPGCAASTTSTCSMVAGCEDAFVSWRSYATWYSPSVPRNGNVPGSSAETAMGVYPFVGLAFSAALADETVSATTATASTTTLVDREGRSVNVPPDGAAVVM